MCRAIASALLVLLASSSAWADQVRRLSEREFIDKYQRVEPQLRMAAADVRIGLAAVTRARTLINPQLSFARESAGGTAEMFAGLGVSLDLGGRGARIDSARAAVSAIRHTQTHRQRQLTVDALGVFYAAVYARERADILAKARAPMLELVKRLRLQAKAGESAGYDSDRLELELVRYDAALSAARNGHTVARLELSRLLGETKHIVDAAGSLDIKQPPPLDTLVGTATQRRADLKAARSRLLAANAAGSAAGRWWVPGFNLSAGLRTVSAAGQTDSGYAVTVSIRLPIFDRKQAARQRARAQQERARAAVSWISLRVRGEIQTSHATLLAALAQTKKLESEQMARADRLVRRATLIYRGGERRVVALVDAHRTALDIRLKRLELQYQSKLAELTLRRALGKRPGGGR